MEYYAKRRKYCVAGKYASVITPFVAIFFAKINEFLTLTEGQTIKLTIGCVLAIIVAVIAIGKEVKEDTKKVSGAVMWGIVLAFVWLFEAILNDLLLIVGCEFAGQCAAAGINAYGMKCQEEKKEYMKLARQEGTIK